MKPQKIKIDKKLKKLNIENEDGPMDNNRKKYYKNMDKKIFNTEINSLDFCYCNICRMFCFWNDFIYFNDKSY